MVIDRVIQVAGVMDMEEASLLRECGVKYIGFPLGLPVNTQDLTEEKAFEIIKKLSPSVNAVLITYLDDASDITTLCRYLGTGIVQLHGDIEKAELQKLKREFREFTVIKSLIVKPESTDLLKRAVEELSPWVDAFITDTFDPASGATGATGKTHDWEISRMLVKHSTRPVILAGGLNPDNVKDAILKVRPAGVDSHTGVEDESGRKCREKVRKFISESISGFSMIGQ